MDFTSIHSGCGFTIGVHTLLKRETVMSNLVASFREAAYYVGGATSAEH
jgi:hypothetical protein